MRGRATTPPVKVLGHFSRCALLYYSDLINAFSSTRVTGQAFCSRPPGRLRANASKQPRVFAPIAVTAAIALCTQRSRGNAREELWLMLITASSTSHPTPLPSLLRFPGAQKLPRITLTRIAS